MHVVFLTENLEYVDKLAIHKVFSELLLSVYPAYREPTKYINMRSKLAGAWLTYDSGGFDYMMGRLKDPDPLKTVQIYKMIGYDEKDILIQLDLPPTPDLHPNKRMELIKKSAEFYHIMKRHISNVVPVMHGWTEKEMTLSLQLIEGSETVAIGAFLSNKRVFDYIGKNKTVAVGMFSVNAAPSLNFGKNKITAKKQKYPSKKEIYKRLGIAFRILLDNDKEIYALGASGPTTLHIAFLCGARYADGSTWRLTAVLKGIILPDGSRRSLNPKSVTYPLFKEKDRKMLQEVWEDELNPFRDIAIGEFLTIASRNDKYGFRFRAIWNAFMLKYIERIANEFQSDSIAYFRYLSRIWPKHKLKLAKIALEATGREAYVQSKLDIFLR